LPRFRGASQGTDLVPTLACIIPVTGTTAGLETTLLSVLERRPDDCEVLVVLGTPYEDPYGLQGEVQFLDANRGAGLVECINVGLAATTATFVHILANGFEATDDWTVQALAHFENPRIGSVTPVVHQTENPARLLSTGVRYRRGGRRMICTTAGDAIGPALHAAFYRKSAIESLGKILPEDLGDDFADLDFAMSLRSAGWQNAIEPNSKIAAPTIESTKAAGLLGGLQAERFFWRHAPEAGSSGEIMAHIPAVVGSLLRATWKSPAQLVGRFLALCQFGSYRLYQQQLAHATLASTAVQSCLVAHAERAAERSAKEKSRIRIDSAHEIQPMRTNDRARSRR
jgi:hypothetical protein